jgi:hypothetical protein
MTSPQRCLLRQPLRLTLLRPSKGNQSVDERRSIRVWRIGRDQLLSLNVQRHVGVEFGD